MRFHKEGIAIIYTTLILFLLVSGISYYFFDTYSWVVIIPLAIIAGLILYFFRNPVRDRKAESNEIIAPVDGKVVVVKEVYEKEFLHTQCIQVSIFMSPLNVHVCRYPVSGKIIYKKYHPGKFLFAWNEKSSELNERTTTVIETEGNQQILFRQIAGVLARRIISYAQEGTIVKAGQDELGFIKFGSRMDVFLPLGTEILVKIGDIVPDGGLRVIARLQS